MSRYARSLGLAACVLLLAQGAHAEDLETELRLMRETMRALQDRVESQERQIEAQNQALEDAGIGDEDTAMSAISSFLEDTDFYGSVSATYTQDLKFIGENKGEISQAFPQDSYNTFALNQLWFGMDRAPTEDSRGGFHIDIAYGKNANGTTDDPEVWAAYVSYLAPIGNGIQIDAGELWTLIGAEVVDTTENYNITRGLVWNLQPVSHVGVIAGTQLTDEISFAIGAVNEPLGDTNADLDNGKTVTWHLGWANDSYSVSTNGIWGSQSDGDESDKYGNIELLVTADPTDSFSAWFDYNYVFYDDTPNAFGFGAEEDSSVHAFALAGRYAFTEKTGFAVRGEFLAYDLDDRSDEQQWSLTGTFDHMLTDSLMARLEARYDSASEDIFQNQNDESPRSKSQAIAIAELVYAF